MTHSLRWQARILVEADRTSAAKAAERHGITTKTIANWRKERSENAELDALYEREDELVAAQYRDGWADAAAKTLVDGFARASEMIPNVEEANLGPLLDALCKLASIVVTREATVSRRKKGDGLPNLRPHSEAGPDEKGERGDRRH
jgi:hypothetical protein